MLRSYFPASRPPDGVTALTTATSGYGFVYGSRCARALTSVYHSVFSVTISPRNSRRITSSASAMRSRWVFGSMPSISASDASSPGPAPNITRPRVW